MNLQTGEKMAKLMDGDDGQQYHSKSNAVAQGETEKDGFSHLELKKALKNFKAEQDDVKDQEHV